MKGTCGMNYDDEKTIDTEKTNEFEIVNFEVDNPEYSTYEIDGEGIKDIKDEKIVKKELRKEIRYKKCVAKIEKKMAQLEYINNCMLIEVNPSKIKRLFRKKERIADRIEELKIHTISPEQLSIADNLRIKTKKLRICVMSLTITCVVLIVMGVLWLGNTYQSIYDWETKATYYMESNTGVINSNSELEQLNSDLSHQVIDLNAENSDLKLKVSQLEQTNSELETKAEWFDGNSRIVIRDSDHELYNTYHTYDCEKWQNYNGAYQVHNIRYIQTVYPEYKKCPDCIIDN